jgi:UDP-glucose 4-epimerase
LGRSVQVVEGPRRAGDPERLFASADKALRELGWSAASTKIDATVGSALNWHLKKSQAA